MSVLYSMANFVQLIFHSRATAISVHYLFVLFLLFKGERIKTLMEANMSSIYYF